jgi:hypothetical protein
MLASTPVSLIRTALAAGYSLTPVAWPREPFVQPTNDAGQSQAFVLFQPDEMTRRRVGIGRVYSTTGAVTIYVMTPHLTGLDLADSIFDTLFPLFDGVTLGAFLTEVEMVHYIDGPSDDGNYDVGYLVVSYRNVTTAS